ncbi:Na+/H+-dicarboxylate symporter [Granulicella rosea]|uniref:Na+/H+-dicarboxylate symporter n=1 Tax=Granulicella rosea TaxID=474952 RepID=A0A239M9A5_9BACT|nr:cation:dicarboxylase symporter family transporter [Granulicella rosea]SNT38419.1 Na+/H+-dicarboxylate symporter [Granulicella rosea]
MGNSGSGAMVRVTCGLAAGLLAGWAVSAGHAAWLPALLEPVGTLFVSAIRVAVIPLVVCGLVAGVAASSGREALARISGRAAVAMLLVLIASALFGLAVAAPAFSHLETTVPLPAGDAPPAPPSVGRWFSELMPANVFKAAVDGALLPLIVVAIGFGLALARVAEERRAAVVRVFQGVADAALVWVAVVVRLAPIGVFALATLLTARLGAGALRAVAWYVGVYGVACMSFVLLVLTPCAVLLGRVPMLRFARAAAPSQAVALASRSSMAALPAAYEGALSLGLMEEVYSLYLPVAASLFRAGAPMAQVVGVVFLAKLYGVTLASSQYVTILVASVLTSLTVPGVPGGSILVMAPVLAAAGIPVSGIALLLGADTIPDTLRTLANVTGWLSVAALLPRASVTSTEQVRG